MNQNDLKQYVGKNVLVTFKNGEAQCGMLVHSVKGNKIVSFNVGAFGGPFKPVNVAAISTNMAGTPLQRATVAVPKSDTGYKPGKRGVKRAAATSAKYFHYNNRHTSVDFTATNLRDAKKVVEAAHPLKRGWTATWEAGDKRGMHYYRLFNSKGTPMAKQGYGAVLVAGPGGPKSGK